VGLPSIGLPVAIPAVQFPEIPYIDNGSNRHNENVRFASYIAVLLCSIGATAQPQLRPVDIGSVTIRQPGKWQSPPRKLHSKIKSGPAQIMILYPSGDFGYLACYLIRQADGAVTISRGDGFVVKVGKWRRSNGEVTVTSRTVYREIVLTGQAIPEPEVVEQFRDVSHDGYWYLRTSDQRFEPMSRFRDLDFLGNIIACDRMYYDGGKYIEGPQPCASTANRSEQ
jgi:hypothetical protein